MLPVARGWCSGLADQADSYLGEYFTSSGCERPSRLPQRQLFAFFAAISIPLLDACEVWVGTVAARQILLVERGVFTDQIPVSFADVGQRPQLAGCVFVSRGEPDLVAAEHVVAHGRDILRREDELCAALVDLRVLEQQNHVAQQLRVQLGVEFVDHYGAAAL